VDYRIVRQPDGDYALWDADAREFVMVDAKRWHVMAFLTDEATAELRRQIARIEEEIEERVANDCDRLERGARNMLTWDGALARYRAAHGTPLDLDAARRAATDIPAYGPNAHKAPPPAPPRPLRFVRRDGRRH
jgi:hypothetical protein